MPTNNAITVFILLGTWNTVCARTELFREQFENQTTYNNSVIVHRCGSGYKGPNCTEVCPDGYHGMDCAFNCSLHCVDKSCDHQYGNCTYGCEYGWFGIYCEEDVLTPEELQRQAIILFFQFIAGIMGFYLLQIAIIKYRSLNIGCCCCCKYCPCNREELERKKRLKEKRKQRDEKFVIEMEPLQIKCSKKCSHKQIVHVV